MLESISSIDLNTYKIKEGDVKVDAEELQTSMVMTNNFLSILCNNMEILDEEEQNELREGLAFFEYMQNKYIVLGDLRRQQKMWWDVKTELDKGDKGKFKNSTSKEIEDAKRNVWENYIEAKTKREMLQAELEEYKK